MKFQEEKSQQKLAALHKKEQEENAKLLALQYGLDHVNLMAVPIEIDALRVLSQAESARAGAIVFQATGRQLKMGVKNPRTEEVKALVHKLEEKRYQVGLFLISEQSFEYGMTFYEKVPEGHVLGARTVEISQERLASIQAEIKTIEDAKTQVGGVTNARITEALEVILAGALSMSASDVHIETQEDERVRIRLRIDGMLQDIAVVPGRLYKLLLSRIKLISQLKLNIHNQAQDGRFTIHSEQYDIEIRVSVLPGPAGENIVLRILDPRSLEIEFSGLGMQPWVSEEVLRQIKQPNGMILVTGPTGSGKTTSLYTFLRTIHTPEIKIITLEDPIEYHLVGIEQTQVDAEHDYTFANGLRAIVRQDPDVLLVGEIRDLETAEVSLQAAHTGHLVFSTLHTNNAAGAVPRLLALGATPPIIAPALNVMMAQRLVRQLCTSCRVAQTLDEMARTRIQQELDAFPTAIPVPKPEEWQLFEPSPEGCAACRGTGYKGRLGVFEIILVDDALKELILKTPSEIDLQKHAAATGQITMRQDGLLKILSGVTNASELERVIGTAE